MSGTPAPIIADPAAAAAVLSALTAAAGPLHLPELASAAGVDSRACEAAVQGLRTAGAAPICSGTAGYWLARSIAELRADIARGERRLRAMHATRRGQKRLLMRLEGERYDLVELLSLWAAA